MINLIKKHFILTSFVSILLVKVILSSYINVTADEGYYLLWSKHLDWSYVDHPGMIAWLEYLFRSIFVDDLFSIRALSLLGWGISAYMVYLVARELGLRAKAAIAALMFSMVPYVFFVNVMVVDVLLILFSTIAFFFFIKLLRTRNTLYYYPLMISCGFGILSKYTIVLLMISMLLAMLWHKEYRKLLLSWHFLFSVMVFIFMMFPIIYWNSNNEWLTLQFHMSRAGSKKWFRYFLPFMGMIIFYYSPVYIYYFVDGIKKYQCKKESLLGGMLVIIFFHLLLFAAILINGGEIYGHYLCAVVAPFIVFIAVMQRERLHIATLFSIIPIIAIFVLGSFATPFPQKNIYSNNKTVRQQVNQLDADHEGELHLYSSYYSLVGLLSFTVDRPVYYPLNIRRSSVRSWGAAQLKLWDRPMVKKGDCVLYLVKRISRGDEETLLSSFDNIQVVNSIDLNAFEQRYYAKRKYTFYHLVGAKRDFIF